MRFLIRLLILYLRALFRGEPYAIWIAVGMGVLIAVYAFVQFARRPLGGDPEKPPIGDDEFRDAKNPYRDFE